MSEPEIQLALVTDEQMDKLLSEHPDVAGIPVYRDSRGRIWPPPLDQGSDRSAS